MRLTYVGHSTTLIEIGGVRVLTDPLLRPRVLHLKRRALPPVRVRELSQTQLVLVSHLHHDHFDPPSLRMLDRSAVVVIPRGTGRAGARLGFPDVIELGAGETVTAAGLEVSATHAEHARGRLPGGRVRPIGFTIAGDERLYFAGDTDLFDGMRALGPLDLALLPVWGWGPRLGPGHLDPERAAEALARLEPRVAVPIHWGTMRSIGLRRVHEDLVGEPPNAFARAAARRAPAVDVRVLQPGESMVIGPADDITGYVGKSRAVSQARFDVIRQGLDALNRRDVDAMLEDMTEDVVVDASRRVLDPVVAEGHDGVRRFMAYLSEAWANQRLEPEELIEADDDVVVPVRIVSTGRGSGATVNARAAWVVRFRGDKISRFCVYQTRAEALEATGLQD